MLDQRLCPSCGNCVEVYKNPIPTVDIVIYTSDKKVLLITRKNPPLGFALPGGFVEQGETAEHAAIREAFEETNLTILLQGILGVYSQKDRDPRFHTLSIVFVAQTPHLERVKAGDDAASAELYPVSNLPQLVFDHAKILEDFVRFLQGTRPLLPMESIS